MKFTFKIQQYQTDAVDAVVNVFEGQSFNGGLSYVQDLGGSSELSFTGVGFANAPIAAGVDLLRNIKKIQHDSNIAESDELVHKLGRVQLDVEMETGTGKTYVYIKTMFELNKRYGWSKFIIVVPSIAIREGVLSGLGVSVDMPLVQCWEEVRDGKLVPILPGWHRPQIECFVVLSSSSWRKRRCRVFAEWFSKALQKLFQGFEDAVPGIVALEPRKGAQG